MYACGIQIIFSVQLYEDAATLKKKILYHDISRIVL